uniref:AlNc14C92G5728 protein n=1 Tax=Albugo laibachii Nc14 TaxID=890382 RepID=F0WGJ4_9STRA|nr:AlNc14C92G5728 [Albugo laibachii Nc14]|eukprot:CCA20358.1 AlNc14C92G5728 [Albugo laibachii Nc14]
MKLYMQHVAMSVGAAVATELGDMFVVILDGSTNGPHHYVDVYGVSAVDGQLRQPLLALSPMESEQSADVHIELPTNVLCLYEKFSDKNKFIVSDNCTTNQYIATKLCVPLVG